MTTAEIKKFYTEQVEWYKREIAWTTEQIEWVTRQMERERAKVRELREYVWNKGVLTETEWAIWGKDGYETGELRKYKNERRRYYRGRKKDEEKLRYYENRLKEVA